MTKVSTNMICGLVYFIKNSIIKNAQNDLKTNKRGMSFYAGNMQGICRVYPVKCDV
jgi:hypothetical protein